MLKHISLLVLTLVWVSLSANVIKAAETKLNTDNGLALHGYDPVSYHSGRPLKGKESRSSDHRGATYLFASRANLESFMESPDNFVPAYGGWCAWAMLDGELVDVDPLTFKVIDGTTYLFYNSFFINTLKKWNDRAAENGETSLIELADRAWKSIVDG
ncbi:MAG: YHS domain-containing (seleno)protein [Desulfofustis sp.]